ELAFYCPVAVSGVAAGLPVEDVPTFYEQAALLTNVAVPPERRLAASEGLARLVQAVIDQRRAEPRDDLISILVQAEITEPDGSKHRLSDEEIVAFLRLLVPAG